MAKIEIHPIPRIYEFKLNNLIFRCQVEHKEEIGIQPVDILKTDLEECIEQLKKISQLQNDNSQNPQV